MLAINMLVTTTVAKWPKACHELKVCREFESSVYLAFTSVGSNLTGLPSQRGGAVPSPMGMGRNGRTDLPRGSTERSPPLSRTVFSLGRPLTGHNWAAPLLLIDRTPFGVSLSWQCSLLVAMSTLTQAPSATILTPGTPAPSAI